jgi:hypothetical protein
MGCGSSSCHALLPLSRQYESSSGTSHDSAEAGSASRAPACLAGDFHRRAYRINLAELATSNDQIARQAEG